MNLEENGLMFIVAKPEKFKEYHVPIEEYVTLESGDIMIHACKCGLNVFQLGCDISVAKLSQEAAAVYLEYVDGYAEKQWVDTIAEEIITPIIKG